MKEGINISHRARKEDIQQECNKRNLIFINSYIKEGHTWITFQCALHLDKGLQQTHYARFRHSKYGCRYCSGKDMTTEDFRQKIITKNPSVLVIGDFVNYKVPVNCQCLKCGNTWSANPKSLVNGSGCPQCGRLLIGQKKRKLHSQFIQEMQVHNPNIEILSQYCGDSKEIKCYCKRHQITFYNIPQRLLIYEHLCPKCVSEYRSKSQALSQEEFEQRVYTVQPDVKILSEYSNYNGYVRAKCLKHNQVYEQLASSLMAGKCGCTKCVGSKGERLITQILQSKSISFIPQYEFEDCRNINRLRFDFFLPEYNCCIEYQGAQHYAPVQFGGVDKDTAQKNFEEIKLRDEIKNQYCLDHNISLLCIPYWEYDNMEQYIDNNLIKQ